MLNYNVNYIEPLQQDKKNSDFRPYIYWGFEAKSIATDNVNLPPDSYTTMSISAQDSNCVNITRSEINQFATDAQIMATASLSGSKWATTGSTTMSLSIVGVPMNAFDPYYYYSGAVSASATLGNISSVSGSVLQNSFTSSEFYNFFVSGSIIHWKGNQYNAPLNWKVDVTSPSASFVSSSFIMNSDSQTIVSKSFASASISGSVNNNYATSQTASLYGSSNYWGSSYFFKECTMSLNIPKIGFYTQSYSTNGRITSSFVDDSVTAYDITASIELKPWTPYPVEVILAGGGGAGGGSANKWVSGGGGGAGSYVSASWYMPVSPVLTSFDIVVGTGGTGNTGALSGSKGTDSTIYWPFLGQTLFIAKGGGGGGSATVGGGGSTDGGPTAAGNGGSGGGGVGGGNQSLTLSASIALTPTTASYQFTTGSNGNTGRVVANWWNFNIASLGGGGGGAAGNAALGAPGPGVTNLFGTFSEGGAGGSLYQGFGSTQGSNGTNAVSNHYGSAGGGANGGTTVDGGGIDGSYKGGSGANGIVIIRYRGPQVATGGDTITTSGGYTTHTFTSNGTFTPTANFQCCA